MGPWPYLIIASKLGPHHTGTHMLLADQTVNAVGKYFKMDEPDSRQQKLGRRNTTNTHNEENKSPYKGIKKTNKIPTPVKLN